MNDLRTRLGASISTAYQLERELGSGGMAVVWLARDLRHRRRVALKVLRPEISELMGRERFLREIETLANLTHPHILPLHDSGEADGLLYYVMPYIEGESLRDRLRRERQLPLDDALHIAHEVADALSYAHGRGVVHRDIKPENILLSGGHALVADFGIATAIDVAAGSRLTETGIAVGTPAYMSPEQALGERSTDARSDVYALGCVLYEMIAGEPPFTGPTAQVVLARRLHNPAPSLRATREVVPEGLDRAVTKALAKLPADRFETAAKFSEALASATASPRSGESAVAAEGNNRPGNPDAPTQRRRRSARPIWMAGGIALAAVAAIATWARTRSNIGLNATRVAVARFENRTRIDSLDALGAILADIVTNGLTRTGLVNVVPTATVMDAAARLSRSRLSLDAKSFGRETGADVIVTGSYFVRGDSLAIQPQVVDVGNNRVLSPIDLLVVPLTDQMAGIYAVLERVKITLSSRVHPLLAKSAPLTGLPKSMAAYESYIAGFETYFGGDVARSREHFYRAAQLDSTFVSALTWAALAEWNLNSNVPKVDSLLKIVERRRDDLLPFDRASLDYLRAWVDGDVEGAQKAARRRAELGGSVWIIFAVQGALRLNRVDEAYNRIREALKARTLKNTPWLYLTQVLHARGDYERELEEVRKAIALRGDDRSLLVAEVRALAALGRIDELSARLEGANTSGNAADRGDMYFTAVTHLRAHGLPAEADRVARFAAQKLEPAVTASPTWRARFELARLFFEAGVRKADTLFSALVTEGMPGPYGPEHFQGLDAAAMGYLGISAATRGDTAGAERVISQLENLKRPYLLGANFHWQARIAGQLGQCERAVRFLRTGLANGSSYQAGAHLPINEIREFSRLSCGDYKEFIKPKG